MFLKIQQSRHYFFLSSRFVRFVSLRNIFILEGWRIFLVMMAFADIKCFWSQHRAPPYVWYESLEIAFSSFGRIAGIEGGLILPSEL